MPLKSEKVKDMKPTICLAQIVVTLRDKRGLEGWLEQEFWTRHLLPYW